MTSNPANVAGLLLGKGPSNEWRWGVDLDKLTALRDLAKSANIAEHSSVDRSRTGSRSVGRQKLAKPIRYAKPSMKEVVSPGAGGGLWTGSQPIDSVLLNQTLRHTRAAMRLARKGGDLNLHDEQGWPDEQLAKWAKLIGKRNMALLVRTDQQNQDEHCDPGETMEAIEAHRRVLGWSEERLEQELRILRRQRKRTNSIPRSSD